MEFLIQHRENSAFKAFKIVGRQSLPRLIVKGSAALPTVLSLARSELRSLFT